MLIKKLNEEVYESGHKDSVKKTYRKLTGMEDDEKIMEEDLQEWAVNKVCSKTYESVDKVRKWLTEDNDEDDLTIDQHNKKIASETNAVAQIDEDDAKGIIERELDVLLEQNKLISELGERNFLNVIFEGRGGVGKTSRIRAWAEKNGVNLVLKKGSEMDVSDFGVLAPPKETNYATKVRTEEFDILDKPNSVLFLDEYNRTPANVRATLLTLINDHLIADPTNTEGGAVKHFPNFLFTIMAVNPYNPNYDTFQLDGAEETRAKTVHVPAEIRLTLKYLTDKLNKRIEVLGSREGMEAEVHRCEGRKGIINKLLSSPNFAFDSDEEEDKVMQDGNRKPLGARNLESLLFNCDGTKKDFLDKWNSWCNNFKKKMAELILKDYVDVEDKANQAIGVGGGEATPKKGKSAFSQKKSLLDIVNDALGDEE